MKQKVWATKNFIKDKMTRRVDILWRILKKMQKSSKWSHRNGKTSFLVNPSENIQLYFNFNFFAVFLKLRQSISSSPVILSFMKFFVAQSSRTNFFLSIVVKLNISVITKATNLFFLVNLPKWTLWRLPSLYYDSSPTLI